MGLSDSTIEMISTFVVFVYANATSILVTGFICWFLGRMGSVNAAVPRFLPQIMHLCAAVPFAVVAAGFMMYSLLRGGWPFGVIAVMCTYLSVRNLRHALLVPRRISVEDAFFEEGSPYESTETLPDPEIVDRHDSRS